MRPLLIPLALLPVVAVLMTAVGAVSIKLPVVASRVYEIIAVAAIGVKFGLLNGVVLLPLTLDAVISIAVGQSLMHLRPLGRAVAKFAGEMILCVWTLTAMVEGVPPVNLANSVFMIPNCPPSICDQPEKP